MALAKPLIVVVGIFFSLSLLFAGIIYSDDIFYFNSAKQAANGALLYTDLFFAHPPVQVWVLSALFTFFGASLFIARLVPVFCASALLVLVYALAPKNKLFAVVILLLMPGFLAFSRSGVGMLLAGMFVALSAFALVRKRPVLAGVLFSFAFFTRYLALMYLPFVFFMYGKNRRFLVSALTSISIGFISLTLMYGLPFIENTLFFHAATKIGITQVSFLFDYATLNLFILVSIAFLFKKHHALLLLATDAFILFLFSAPFYHYVLISLPFFAVVLSEVKQKDVVLFALLFGILLAHATIISSLQDNSELVLVLSRLDRNATLFGDPIVVNYASFLYNTPVFEGEYDSFPQHLGAKGWGDVVMRLGSNPPQTIIMSDEFMTQSSVLNDFIAQTYELLFNTSHFVVFSLSK
ncbi:hypothetical protein COT72_00370 [archaeon CG10_big_fil_rev_8_21_14_0_10_43_11]|nr:MAG: hypothetical protein COT72_00370 [archaeon CG10_big_fil_rev_8_21_14_0_10_43_11]